MIYIYLYKYVHVYKVTHDTTIKSKEATKGKTRQKFTFPIFFTSITFNNLWLFCCVFFPFLFLFILPFPFLLHKKEPS